MQFAAIDELADWLGDDTVNSQATRAQLLLEAASAQVDAWCNLYDFEQTTGTVELTGTHSDRLELPGRPVDSVSAVTVDGTTVTDWTLVGDVLWRHGQGSWGGPAVTVQVTYTHGFATVPGDVKAVVLTAAARTWRNPALVQSEQTGPFGTVYNVGGALGGVTLTDSEKDALSRYRRTSGALTL